MYWLSMPRIVHFSLNVFSEYACLDFTGNKKGAVSVSMGIAKIPRRQQSSGACGYVSLHKRNKNLRLYLGIVALNLPSNWPRVGTQNGGGPAVGPGSAVGGGNRVGPNSPQP